MENFESYGLVEQPNSGSVSGKVTTYVFSGICKGKAKEALNDLLAASVIPNFRGETVQRSSCSIAREGMIETLTIVTGPLSSGSGSSDADESYAEFSLETNRIEKAIETHPNYKLCWTHDLYYAIPSSSSGVTIPAIPAWYVNGKANPVGDTLWCAAKEWPADIIRQGVPAHYVLASIRTKPAVEVYPVDAPVVTEYKRFSSLTAAKRNLRISNKLLAPGECFNYSSKDECWLVHPDGIIEEDGDFITRNIYQYSDGWDTEIYEFA